MTHMRATGRAATLSLALLIALANLALPHFLHRDRGDFRIDEAHKISESAFFTLWSGGQIHHPAWFSNRVDRSNPPVGKYLFGAAISASGASVPSTPTLSSHAVDGIMPGTFPPNVTAPYAPLLKASRFVSTIAVALLAGIVTFISFECGGWLAALIAIALFQTNYLTLLLCATAVFDPIVALFAAALLVPLMAILRQPEARHGVWLIAHGIFGALAFQTRLNGALPYLISLLVLLWFWKTSPSRRLRGAAFSLFALMATTLILNPFYWATAPSGVLATMNGGSLLLRPLHRLHQQWIDLTTILNRLLQTTGSLSIGDRFRFLFEIVFGDWSGLLLSLGAILGILSLTMRRELPARAGLLCCAITTIVFVAMLPLAWPRYLFLVVPPLAIMAGSGYASALAVVRSRMSRERA